MTFPIPEEMEDDRLFTSVVIHGGSRIDKYLADHTDFTRSAIQRLFGKNAVHINGKVIKKNAPVQTGDVVTVVLPTPKPTKALAENIPLTIIYEDSDLLVVNKPQGMVVPPAPGNERGTLVNALLYHYKDNLSGIGGGIRPGIVHRIDKNTAGLLLVAKNDFAHVSLAEQIRAHTLLRQYEAVVYGTPKDEKGIIDKPLGRSLKDRKKMAVFSKTGEGIREAVTHYEVLVSFSGYAHVRCRLETGRTHQIRLHMASIGHPVVGDDVYAPGRPTLGLMGQCLVARTLGLVHPRTGEALCFTCELPAFFLQTLNQLTKLQ